MVEVKNINKKYYNQVVLNNISFSLNKGEIVGFLGPNGAGKSTMMKILTGYTLPNDGCVKIDGDDILSSNITIQTKIGYLPENNPLYFEMYVIEYLEYICNVRNIEIGNIEKVISLVGLHKEKYKKIKQLSKGYKQRVGLAQAIIHNPKVLILDEPTTGLDPNQLVEIRNLIIEIGRDKTVIFSTHIMQEVEAICDRVIIINNGNIVADRKINELIDHNDNQVVLVEFDFKIEKEYISKHFSDVVISIENLRDSFWRIIFKHKNQKNIKDIYDFSENNNLKILQLTLENKNLEKIFNEYTNK